MFLSSTGLLIAKKKLFKNPIPDGAGGGTVLFVSIEKDTLLSFRRSFLLPILPNFDVYVLFHFISFLKLLG